MTQGDLQNICELYGGQEAASIAAAVVTVQRRQLQVNLWRLHWGFCDNQNSAIIRMARHRVTYLTGTRGC